MAALDPAAHLKDKWDRESARSAKADAKKNNESLVDFSAFSIFFASSFALSRSHFFGD